MTRPKPVTECATLEEFFDQDGTWCQHVSRRMDDHGNMQYCLAGAVRAKHGAVRVKPGADDPVLDVLIKVGRHLGRKVTMWNDLPDRTIEDVRKVCRELRI